MSRLKAEHVRAVVLDALVLTFGDNADRFEDDDLRLGVSFSDGTFIEVLVQEQAPRTGRSDR